MASEPNYLGNGDRSHYNGHDRQSRPLTDTVSDDLDKMSDIELMNHLKAGSPDPIAILFARYRHLVFSISMKILRDVTEAEDVVQDIFLELFQKADRFDAARGTVQGWIVQYAYSRSLNRRRDLAFRKSNGHGRNGNGAHWQFEASHVPDTVEKLTIEKRVDRIIKAFEGLSFKQRETLELIYFHGFLIKEVADRTGDSVENVRNYYYRGLKRLREVLAVRVQDWR